MEQKSDEWLKWRLEGIGSSEAAGVMQACPYNSRYSIWLEKTGRLTKKVEGPHIDRGNHFEPKARATFELMSGDEYAPKLFVHPKHKFLRASLDGYCEEKQTILEIKVPGVRVWNEVQKGEIPVHYMWQLEHQLMVSGAKEAYFMCVKLKDAMKVYDNEIVEHKILKYSPIKSSQKRLLDTEVEFWTNNIQKNIMPDLIKRDILMREDDDDVKALYMELRDKKLIADHLHEQLELARLQVNAVKDRIIPKMKHEKETAFGVMLTKNSNCTYSVFLKKGSNL